MTYNYTLYVFICIKFIVVVWFSKTKKIVVIFRVIYEKTNLYHMIKTHYCNLILEKKNQYCSCYSYLRKLSGMIWTTTNIRKGLGQNIRQTYVVVKSRWQIIFGLKQKPFIEETQRNSRATIRIHQRKLQTNIYQN